MCSQVGKGSKLRHVIFCALELHGTKMELGTPLVEYLTIVTFTLHRTQTHYTSV